MTDKEKPKEKKKEAKPKPVEKKQTDSALPKKAEKPIEKKEHVKPVKKQGLDIKLFNKWDTNVEVRDLGLKRYMNLSPKLLPRSAGIYRERFHKSKAHIVERLALHLMVPGHTGKRHRITSGRFSGGYIKTMQTVEKAFDIIEQKEKKNPFEVFVRALENAAVSEEIISYQLGSIVARDAVITAPQRRIDKTLRIIAQASYKKSFSSKKSIEQALADELIAAYKASPESAAIKERERIEREAAGAR